MRFLNNTKLIIVTSFIFVVLVFLPVPPIVARTETSPTICLYSLPSEVVAGVRHLLTRRHLPHLRYTNVTLTGPVGS